MFNIMHFYSEIIPASARLVRLNAYYGMIILYYTYMLCF